MVNTCAYIWGRSTTVKPNLIRMKVLAAVVLHSAAALQQPFGLDRRSLLGAVLIPGPAAAMMPVCSELITENCRRPYKLT